METDLEAVLANPPLLSAVLEDRVLHKVPHTRLTSPVIVLVLLILLVAQMFKWHLASRFAPENMLFRDAVCDFQRLCRAGEMETAKQRAKSIVKTFMDPASAFEVPTRGHVIDTDTKVTEELFNPVLEHIDRDLSRALQTLWPTPIFRSYLEHKDALAALNKDPEDEEQRKPDRNTDPLLVVRNAFNATEKLRMRRHFEVGSPYTYAVFTSTGNVCVGYCRQADDLFVFYDTKEKVLLETPAAALLGHSQMPKTPRLKALDADDDGVAGSGCFGGGRRASGSRKNSSASEDPSLVKWAVKTQSTKELGPFAYRDVQLWWRFHLLPLSASVRRLHDPKMDAITNHFPAAGQIQLIDPTALSEFGEMQL